MREITMTEAIREALIEEMTRDKDVFVLGEDVGPFGGCFGVTGNLYKNSRIGFWILRSLKPELWVSLLEQHMLV